MNWLGGENPTCYITRQLLTRAQPIEERKVALKTERRKENMKINKIWAYILWITMAIAWLTWQDDKFWIVAVIAGLITTL